jgi:hypothetical protein
MAWTSLTRKEMEDISTDLEINERVAKARIMHVASIKSCAETMSFIDPDWKQDAWRVRQAKEVLCRGLLFSQQAIEEPGTAPTNQKQSKKRHTEKD